MRKNKLTLLALLPLLFGFEQAKANEDETLQRVGINMISLAEVLKECAEPFSAIDKKSKRTINAYEESYNGVHFVWYDGGKDYTNSPNGKIDAYDSFELGRDGNSKVYIKMVPLWSTLNAPPKRFSPPQEAYLREKALDDLMQLRQNLPGSCFPNS